MNGYPLRVGESIIPLFISVPRKTSVSPEDPQRPLRWVDTRSPALQRRFRDLAYFISHHAAYDTPTDVPSRTKGKNPTRRLREGFKPLQVLVQPERGLYRKSGSFVENDDALCFYDLDRLPFTRYREIYGRLLPLMETGKAFVWINARQCPKAAFWVRLRGATESPEAMLTRIHQEVFQGDPECAPALGASDMWKSFVHSAETLEGMRLFFGEAYRRHVQTIHDAAMAREAAWHARRLQEIAEALAQPGTEKADEPPPPVEDPTPQAGTEGPISPIETYIALMALTGEMPDAFSEYLDREFAPRLDHALQFPLYEEPLPPSLFGRKTSRFQELALRLALSMPGRLLGAGVGIPSTLIQRLAHQFYPDDFPLRFDTTGKLDASSASKAIRELVKRGILEVADHRFRPGAVSKSYRAVHPDLIGLAQARLGSIPGRTFRDRTADDVDARWTEITGHPLSETPIDGVRDQVIYRLTNLCPTYEVFEEAALRIPGMRQNPERMRFLPSQWQAHLERDRGMAQVEGDAAP